MGLSSRSWAKLKREPLSQYRDNWSMRRFSGPDSISGSYALLGGYFGMPYLTYVGPDYERGGPASRDYWVFRKGRWVITRFGSITIDRHRTYRVEWWYGGYNERVMPCRMEEAAAELVKKMSWPKIRQRHS
jgi:hypothetical protein